MWRDVAAWGCISLQRGSGGGKKALRNRKVNPSSGSTFALVYVKKRTQLWLDPFD